MGVSCSFVLKSNYLKDARGVNKIVLIVYYNSI